MAQHWGGLQAMTAISHNWLVSQRAGACHHTGRQAEAAASATGWHGNVLRVALHAEQPILSMVKYRCPFMCLVFNFSSDSSVLDVLYLTLYTLLSLFSVHCSYLYTTIIKCLFIFILLLIIVSEPLLHSSMSSSETQVNLKSTVLKHKNII